MMKMRCRHYDTLEVIKAESQAVLNSLTEHNFQDAFKEKNAANRAYVQNGTTSRVMLASRPTVSF
jgi:hypothetical protein